MMWMLEIRPTFSGKNTSQPVSQLSVPMFCILTEENILCTESFKKIKKEIGIILHRGLERQKAAKSIILL